MMCRFVGMYNYMPTYCNIQAVCPTSGLSRTRTPNDGGRAQIALAVLCERVNRSRRPRSARRKTTVRMGSGMTNQLQQVSMLRKTLRPRYTSTGLRNVEMRSNARLRSGLTPHSRAICAKGPRQASGGRGKCGFRKFRPPRFRKFWPPTEISVVTCRSTEDLDG